MKKALIASLILVLACGSAFCLVVPEDYIKDGIGIRPIGMGGAFTAVADDLNAGFYNPAGLDSIAAFNYEFGNMDYNSAVTKNDVYSAFNLGLIGITHIARENLTGDKVNNTYYSIGQRGGFGLSYGLTYKNVEWGGISSGVGYSTDLGIKSRISPNFSIGLLWQDFAHAKTLDVPTTTRLGAAYRLNDDDLILAADVESGRSTPGNYSYYGAEWRVSSGFTLRAGASGGKPTLGFGMSSPVFNINYAAYYDNSVAGGTIHMFSIGTSFGQKRERPFSVMRPKEFAVINIEGNIVGGIGEFSFLGGGKTGADSVIAYIKDASNDPYIDGIILKIRGFDGGLGSMGIVQEIRRELKKYRHKGKMVIAYIETSALGEEYYLASAADIIVAPPSSIIGGIGKSISITRIKGLLDKIGVESQIIATGRYKTTFNMFQGGLTRDQDKMMRLLVSDMYIQLVEDIAKDRKAKGVTLKKMKEIADGRVMSADTAKALHLIDSIGYFKDAAKSGAKALGDDKEPLVVERKDLFVQDDRSFLISFPNKIAVIEINDDIVTGNSGQNMLFGGKTTGSDAIVEQIKKASDDWQIKAILVRINSGGGSAIGSRQIYEALKKAKEKGKTVVASCGDLAASGGYYIACASNKIVADPATITGSIGVIGAQVLVMKDLFEKIGVKVETIKEGDHMDMFSGIRRLTTREAQSLMAVMQEDYDDFLAAVAEGRGMTTAEVRGVAEGRIFTGSQAKDLKMVDTLGNFTDAVDEAAKLAGISGKPELIYYRDENPMLAFSIGTMKAMGLENGLLPQMKNDLTEYKLY